MPDQNADQNDQTDDQDEQDDSSQQSGGGNGGGGKSKTTSDIDWTNEEARNAYINRIAAREARKATQATERRLREDQEREDAIKRGDEKKLREDAERERDAARTELRTTRAESAVIKAAVRAGSDDPDLVFKAVRDDLEFGDDGKPTNVSDLVSALKKERPRLFGGGTDRRSGADGGKGGESAGGDDMNQIIRRMARKQRLGS